MNPLKKVYCRVYQFFFHIAIPILPYREPKVYESIEDIEKILNEVNAKSVLLVTDKNLREFGITKSLEECVKNHHINLAIYDKTRPNPTVENVEEALALYKEENCEAIIAFGGGSPMDCAKGVGARVAKPNKELSQLKGLLKVRKKIPTLVAIPTTAGTGSEVTLAAVITDSKNKYKYAMSDFSLIPHYAILDPKVTLGLPKSLTGTTGMDALTHAVEAYIGKSTTKETRARAREAIKLIFDNILIAYNDGSNIEARKNMLTASYKAGIAFSKSYVGYVHAVAHSLGGEYNIPHGYANAILMPYVLEEYGKSAHKKLHELAILVGLSNENESDEIGAKLFIEAIKEFNAKMDIPTKFPEIKAEDIPKMAAHADKEGNPLYPVPKLMNQAELEVIYNRVMIK